MFPPQPPSASPLIGQSAPLTVGGAPLYLTGEDALKLTVLNSAAGVTVKVSGRFLPMQGGGPVPFVSTLVPATDRTASTKIVPLAEGWLLNAQAIVSAGSPQTGQTFAILSLVRGVSAVAEDLFTLAAGAITSVQRLSYPGSAVANTLDGAGALRYIIGTNPGAGNVIVETVPTGARWQLLSFKFNLSTSAVAGNRTPSLTLDDGANYYYESIAHTPTAASSNRDYLWQHGLPIVIAGNTVGVWQGFSPTLWIPSGHRIRIAVAALDAGDALTAIRYVVREWLEGN